MIEKNKTCFVIMGFGKKMDYMQGKEIDLDLLYNKVIQYVFQERFPEYTLIRSDEISISQMIDASMYALIMKADLVIAVISTLNANALYELGIRHSEKPFSTIIMMQESEKRMIPFDLNHIRILTYQDYDEELSEKEAAAIRGQLRECIANVEIEAIDSPIFATLPEEGRPDNIDRQFQIVLKSFQNKKRDKSVRMMIDEAKSYQKKDNLEEAEKIWKTLHNVIPKDPYIIQQMAFSQYKSGEKKAKDQALEALEIALETIQILEPDTSLDLETLGITGAIYKRMYKLTGNFVYLDKAVFYYRKGYMIKNDYYNGENYAFCLLETATKEGTSQDEDAGLRYMAKKIFQEIIVMLEENLATVSEDKADVWMYASLSTSYYCMGNLKMYEHFRELF